MVRRCGLLTNNREPVPLKGIEVELEVKDHVATVVSTQHYENKEDKAIEAVFVFPLPGDAAVCHFSAKVGQTEIVAEVKEKQKARDEYDDALSSGQQAFLLEESEQSPDIFSLSVGSLPPGESASIRLEYIIELAVQADDALRFCLPAVLNPRYQPQGSEGGSVQVTSVPASQVPYSLSFSARVSSPRQVSKIDSNCSLEPLQYLNAEQSQAVVKLAAGHKFDRDVELLIYYKDAHQPAAVVEAGQAPAKPGTLMGDAVVMLSVYPEFPQAVMSSLASSGEFVFLLDRSGSMGCLINNIKKSETRISSARDTLLLLLKSLPVGCYFNIYSFGSRFEHIFPTSVEYSEKTMEEALKKVNEFQANLGGTEILQPLKHIYNQPCIPSQPRQVFVFTDGEVGNTKEVLNLVKKNSTSHRCFSFGIGEGASTALIDGLAKEGGGHAQFITGADRMQAKVMQSLQFALQPTVKDILVKWDLPKGVSVTVLSPPLTSIFQGQRSLIYVQLTGQSSEATDGCVSVEYSLAGHPYQNQLHFALQPTEETGRLTIHRLCARTLIRCLETKETERGGQQDETVKVQVVDVSVQSGVSSSFTAFVAINKASKEAVQGPLLRRNIPTPSINYKACLLMEGATKKSKGSIPMMKMQSPMPPTYSYCDSIQMTMENADQKFEGGIFHSLKMRMRGSKKKSAPSTRKSADSCVEKTLASSSPTDPWLQLVSLQKASGSWELKPTLAAVLGKTSKEVEKLKPASANENVWATILALVWLHGFKSDAEVEWKLLARKAASWLLSLNAPSVTDCVVAANTLLGCNVQKDTLGL
ncbi:von Willebrand factor A domain-containing protein 5A-like isoform X1 [Nerophis lumbriciformis]|uniref:von Willebrand factor A domain-containing protein 5A-like isoform X1 n=1 Tax=Nerophis lumbriciformis TaxID=546530 RepID=UPI002AE0A9EF|nr:von Willebrand factor A domain-containing protein 5A-like isoform X1 [Nerophis lumbriciformis]XP_061828748.1 von Willebrand factor A domain-containing protein 5A-like isoform X1 [Nerophis lumbriciformis]XP_061828749.1 von Willebrand factor A domain-containing protein 5A-like isoform X1 [Nerophis lumbriciformis]XP_061828862.1 von Willebrand factor A domain-containing protein 5A-like isoform X1 [Nerophis lumbriciformis]XP_061828863.1 von Willebrand factor A domain-containing protein 5A-like is